MNIFGAASITGGAVQALCHAGKPIAHLSTGGYFYGLTSGMGLKNVLLRREQFRRAEDDWFCVRLARDLVSTKIRNQRTLLQRNHVEPQGRVLDGLKRLARRAQDAQAATGASSRPRRDCWRGMSQARSRRILGSRPGNRQGRDEP